MGWQNFTLEYVFSAGEIQAAVQKRTVFFVDVLLSLRSAGFRVIETV